MRGGPVRGSPWVLGLFGDLCLLATLILAVQGDGRSALLAGAAGLVLSGAAPAAKSDHERSAQGLLPKPSDREMDERLAALLLDVDAAALRALHLVPGELITEGIRWSAADAVLGAATARSSATASRCS